MKRYISLILSVLMIISLCACNSKGSKGEGSSNTKAETETTTSAPNQEQLNFKNLGGYKNWTLFNSYDLSSPESAALEISTEPYRFFCFNDNDTISVKIDDKEVDCFYTFFSEDTVEFRINQSESSESVLCSLSFSTYHNHHGIPVLEVGMYYGEGSNAAPMYLIPDDFYETFTEVVIFNDTERYKYHYCFKDEYLNW